ncbi:MAG: anti-sigma factor [Anaerolineae bacterium]
MSVDNHVVDLLPAYALDCLDEDEIIQVSEHLAVCAACRAALDTYQGVADQLALIVPETEPPLDLKARLMDRIQPARPPFAARQPQRSSWWGQLWQLMQRTTPAWGLASLVLVLALVVGNLWLWQQVSRTQETDQSQIFQTIPLRGTEITPMASGVLVVSLDGEHGTLVVDGLPPLSEEQQYQLWLIHDGQRTSGGVFSVSDEGYGSLWVSSPQPLSSYSGFGITIEPAGGSPGPTGDKVLGSSS